MGAKILGIEYLFPDIKVTNEDLQTEFQEYDISKFETKVGIKCRYIADKNQTALDLAVEACQKLLCKVEKELIDYVLYCTQSPEYFLPTSACILQDRLGLRKNIGALDFNLGCSGYTYGLSLANGLILSGQANNVLLVTAETYSKFINKEDRSNRAIFGDAATATLISKTHDEQIGQFLFGTDGSGYDKLIVRNGASKTPFTPNANKLVYGSDNIYTDNDLYMDGPAIFNFTTEVIPPFIEEVVAANNINKDRIDQYIFHQANAFMLNLIRKRLKIDQSKFYISLEDGGNTVSNTIPIALKRFAERNIVDLKLYNVILAGFGVGLSWSGGLVKLGKLL
ncbi:MULTISPECIES: 3-oxoacyl-ACP synthase III family protein [Olivibacter]|jgi:3-oxoacyl-[acyl-carrier-protein] synthase-3|uniref:3-oxoacyl-ACP synthase III family protein n=1 Tax=Olivibacter oleidegradans TaxID=760123 RepID=A0ABV6HGC2_9SPHI|nr:ketoacyl-ACP synthase III [Olivibacter jilunii]